MDADRKEGVEMNRRKFLLGTVAAGIVVPVAAKSDWKDGYIQGLRTYRDRLALSKIEHTIEGHTTWVWDDQTSKYLQNGYKFVHDDDGIRVKRKSSRFPNTMSYLMKKYGIELNKKPKIYIFGESTTEGNWPI